MRKINLAGLDDKELEEFLLDTKREVDSLNRAELKDILTYALIALPVCAVSEYIGRVFNLGGNFSLISCLGYLGAAYKVNSGYFLSRRRMAGELVDEAEECMGVIERRRRLRGEW